MGDPRHATRYETRRGPRGPKSLGFWTRRGSRPAVKRKSSPSSSPPCPLCPHSSRNSPGRPFHPQRTPTLPAYGFQGWGPSAVRRTVRPSPKPYLASWTDSRIVANLTGDFLTPGTGEGEHEPCFRFEEGLRVPFIQEPENGPADEISRDLNFTVLP